MTTAALHAACIGTTGSEHYEAVIATGTRYAVPRHGDPVRWDWGVTLRSLDFAMQRHRMLADFVAEMTPEQRAAAWSMGGHEGERLRRAMKR